MSNTNAIKLSDQIARRTAGSTPSERTKDTILRRALESDNIKEVKGALLHTWNHYESLELALVNYDDNAGTLNDLREAIKSGEVTDDVDNWDEVIVGGLLGQAVLEVAYMTAHTAEGMSSLFGGDNTKALEEFGYPHLDYSDPERELSDDELLKLSGQASDEESGK
jgi:hypothetical protein